MKSLTMKLSSPFTALANFSTSLSSRLPFSVPGLLVSLGAREVLGEQGMGKVRSEGSTPYICCVRALCVLLAGLLAIIAAPSAISGDVPHSATGTGNQLAVSRLIIRF